MPLADHETHKASQVVAFGSHHKQQQDEQVYNILTDGKEAQDLPLHHHLLQKNPRKQGETILKKQLPWIKAAAAKHYC